MASADFSYQNAEESPGFLLWQVTNFWQREIKKSLELYDLTHAQFVLLASIHWLTTQQTAVTQVALAHHTRMDPTSTSTVLRTLQGKKLIHRREHKTDTRAKIVTLTSSGQQIVKGAIEAVEQFDRTFFAAVSGGVQPLTEHLQVLLKQSASS